MRVIFLDMCFIPYSRADVVGQVSDTKMCLFFILILSTLEICQSLAPRNVYTNHWAVRIAGGQEEADKLAVKYGYNNYGQIGSLEDHYHFHHSRVVRRAAFSTRGAHSFIQMDPKVDWVQQQLVKQRVKRYIQRDTRSPDPNFVHFNDPKWSNMWYIHCTDKNNRCRSEMNILAAWQRGYTGKNVVVTILDDGIERNHPDLAQNYDQLASYDVNGNDHDPTPRYDSSNENKHGTRCAGEVAAVANNSHCIVGIAYNARIGGIRMLDGDVTDVVEAKSLGIRPDYIDIYSASWGPDDDGKTVDGPGPLAKQAFEMGIKKGRKGLGSIFVWASGNGGRQGDHCSCDGYTNSIYTISISSTTENGNKPWYLEVCSSTLATTYSSGEFYDRKIRDSDNSTVWASAETKTQYNSVWARRDQYNNSRMGSERTSYNSRMGSAEDQYNSRIGLGRDHVQLPYGLGRDQYKLPVWLGRDSTTPVWAAGRSIQYNSLWARERPVQL
nr:LOW QUALITY PROTEIN: proprotein convertase subtilisin/kexin type 6-like [Salvelinus alpinus]